MVTDSYCNINVSPKSAFTLVDINQQTRVICLVPLRSEHNIQNIYVDTIRPGSQFNNVPFQSVERLALTDVFMHLVGRNINMRDSWALRYQSAARHGRDLQLLLG